MGNKKIAVVREETMDFSGSFGPNCDPGRFEVMLVVRCSLLIIHELMRPFFLHVIHRQTVICNLKTSYP
jgi:hypothetical protein